MIRRKVIRKRLPRTKAGSVRLASGEFLRKSQQVTLQKAVRKANRERIKLIDKLPEKAKRQYKEFGKQSDFVYRKKSARLNRFKSKQEYYTYLRSVQAIGKGYYSKKIISRYRSNYYKSLSNTFGSEADDIKKYLDKLSDQDFRDLTLNEDLEDIGYVYYEPVAKQVKLERIRKQVTRLRR